jgi:hypothetical protein
MRFYRLSSLLLVIILLFTACSRAATSSQVTPPAKPQAEKATIIGRALDKKTGQPLANRVLRLGEVVRKEGAAEDEGLFIMRSQFSPGTRTDANGYFIFENIEAKEYVLLLEVVIDAYYNAAKGDNGKVLRWKTEAGKILDIGTIYIPLDTPD